MESSYGSLLASAGSMGDSSSGSGDEEGEAGSNGAARRREGGTIGSWPFNLGSLVSSLAGGKPSSSGSSSSVPAASRSSSLNGGSANGAGPAAAAASNGSSSGSEGGGRESTIDPQVGSMVGARYRQASHFAAAGAVLSSSSPVAAAVQSAAQRQPTVIPACPAGTAPTCRCLAGASTGSSRSGSGRASLWARSQVRSAGRAVVHACACSPSCCCGGGSGAGPTSVRRAPLTHFPAP